MTIDQTDVVDLISRELATDEIVLRIFDHLPWSDDHEENMEHIYLLQEKLNTYLAFIESGEINEKFPPAIGRTARLEVVAKYEMCEEANVFFRKFQDYLDAHGFKLVFRHSPTE
jgi:hypothetical protein